MSKAFDKLVSKLEPAESYASVATCTRFKGKATMVEAENPETHTAKEVDLKLSAFMDELRRQFSLIMDLLRDSFVDWTEEISMR